MSRLPSGSTPRARQIALLRTTAVFLDLHAQRVEEDHRVHRLQRPRLPGGDFGITASETELMNSGETSTA